MAKWIMFILVFGAGIFGVSALLTQVNDHAKALEADKKDAGSSLKIVASNWKLDQAEYHVKAGETKKLVLVLKEGIHEIQIDGLSSGEVKLTQAAPSKEIKFDKAGTYQVHCVLPCGTGHLDMHANLIVDPA